MAVRRASTVCVSAEAATQLTETATTASRTRSSLVPLRPMTMMLVVCWGACSVPRAGCRMFVRVVCSGCVFCCLVVVVLPIGCRGANGGHACADAPMAGMHVLRLFTVIKLGKTSYWLGHYASCWRRRTVWFTYPKCRVAQARAGNAPSGDLQLAWASPATDTEAEEDEHCEQSEE